MDKSIDAQVALSVKFAEGGQACVVFRADRGEGPRSGAIPTLVGALLAGSLARMGPGEAAAALMHTVERAAHAFAAMGQPSVLPEGLKLVEPDQLASAETLCTILIPAAGDDFVRGVFASDDPDVAYKAFLYGLQFAIDSLPPESLVALASVLKNVVAHFQNSPEWPSPAAVERDLATGEAGLNAR